MFETLFGGDLSVPVRFAIAFGVVLSLIALTFVGIRRFAGRRLPLSNGGRARQPRLGVLDAFAIDARRRLVLIRRDNVEHLIMIGGPNDVLVESEIVRAPAQAALAPQQARRAPGENSRAAIAPLQNQAPGQVQQRPLPAPEQPAALEPAEPAPLRPAAFRNALQRPAEPAPAVRTATAAAPMPPAAMSPAAMPPARPAAPPPAPPRAQREVAVEGAEPEAAKPKANIDPLYADIERKLGEALSRAPSSPPTAPPPPPARTSAPPPPPARASAPPPGFDRPAPSFSRPATPPPPPAPARPAAPPLRRPEPAAAPAAKDAGSKSHLDALEEEMASLLGRDRSS